MLSLVGEVLAKLGWIGSGPSEINAFVIASCLKFYSSRTRLLTIWHLRTFVIYLYLTFHLASYVHHLKIFFLFRILIWEHTVQDLSPWQSPHSGKLCRLTLRIAPQCPFLKTDLKLSFLKKHFYNFLAIFILVLRFEALLLLLLLFHCSC